ncbi:Head assembly protein [Beijerinckiaceae bacterium RH AL1]|nr:DUF4864 domain-containing protein [Beijerinckiaceae bacterium]VVB42165.1 Head assembly protein [Beijerinckiaceae bacterium RH AL8]VVB42166.1 Head assembly protein [Beijerinckiaceae bacterium RH CH11]VVC53171.1 Head assembly protein [Beijerinckiaceae bacterium RH AL1]
MRRLRLAIPIALGLFAAPALAADGDVDEATKAAIQHIITGQLDALEHEDGDKAESFAADGIRQKFPNGPAFLAMVHQHYAALIHPKRTTFGAVDASPHGPLQTVTVVAADGTIWTAIYSFEQTGGAWRITGCSLRKIEGEQEI